MANLENINLKDLARNYIKDRFFYDELPDVNRVRGEHSINENGEFNTEYKQKELLINFIKEKFPKGSNLLIWKQKLQEKMDMYKKVFSNLSDKQLLSMYEENKFSPNGYRIYSEIYHSLKSNESKMKLLEDAITNGWVDTVSPTFLEELGIDNLTRLLTISMNKGDYIFAQRIIKTVHYSPEPFKNSKHTELDKKFFSLGNRDTFYKTLNKLCYEEVKKELTNGTTSKIKKRSKDPYNCDITALMTTIINMSIQVDKDPKRVKTLEEAQKYFNQLPTDSGYQVSDTYKMNKKLGIYSPELNNEDVKRKYGIDLSLSKQEKRNIDIINKLIILQNKGKITKEMLEKTFNNFSKNYSSNKLTLDGFDEGLKEETEDIVVTK